MWLRECIILCSVTSNIYIYIQHIQWMRSCLCLFNLFCYIYSLQRPERRIMPKGSHFKWDTWEFNPHFLTLAFTIWSKDFKSIFLVIHLLAAWSNQPLMSVNREEGWWECRIQTKSICLFNASQPSCVTLTCTNLTNRKINEAPAHHSSPLSAQETPAFTYCGMLASLVDLLGCQQTMHFHSHTSPEPGGNIRTHCILCCESYQKTTGPPSRAHKYEIICHFPKWN